MDPNEAYRLWYVAVLSEETDEAIEHYENLRAWIQGGGFEPDAFLEGASGAFARKQFYSFSVLTGCLS